MNPRSITFRLLLLYSTMLLLAGIGFSFLTVITFRHYTYATIEDVVAARGRDVWNVTQGSLDNAPEVRQLIERRFSPAAEDRFIRMRVGNDTVYQSGFPVDRTFNPKTIPFPVEAKLPDTYQIKGLIIHAAVFSNPGEKPVVIESGQSDAFFRGLDSSLVESLATALPILLAIAAIGAYVLIRRALSPVELMIGVAEDITFNDPTKRLPLLGTSDRIEALGLALNRMLDRLDNAYQHANRFSADAAHEMRTPLSIIRAGLEFAITNHDLPPKSKDYLADLLDEATRLGHMTDNLLILTRMDTLWGKNAHSELDLYRLTCEVVEQMSFVAEAQGIQIARPTGGAVVIAGDRDRIKQALVNLLDNAIKYNTPGGRVWVDVRSDADSAIIEIGDSGIGITPESQEFIFDRFFRVATDRGATGTGLGLAIVRSICHAHGGSVEVRSALGKGSIFSLRFPLNVAHVTRQGERPAAHLSDAAQPI